MFGRKPEAQETTPPARTSAAPVTLLTVVGDTAKMEGKFQIAESIQIDCEVGGELRVTRGVGTGVRGVALAAVACICAARKRANGRTSPATLADSSAVR